MLKPQYLFEVGKLLIIGQLLDTCVTHVPRLAAQRKNTVGVTADDAETRDRERFSRIALGDDQRTLMGFVRPGPVRVVELWNSQDS